MAAIATSSQEPSSSTITNFNLFEFEKGIKKCLANSSSVPSKFNFINEPTALTANSDSLPVVDFSELTSSNPDQRSRSIHVLSRACQEWGFFILVNHGIPEELMNAIFAATREFLGLPDEEKKRYQAKTALDPIQSGNVNFDNQSFTLWRDYLKLYVHPDFHCPDKPHILREVVQEYCERSRKLARNLVEAICESLEIERRYVDEDLKLDSSFQLFATNLYPPCPQPDRAIGLPPHTDPGLLTFIIHNGVAGLQIEHDEKWFNVDSPKNSILVNVADQLQILSNGRCKSVKHRAVLNNERERISIVVANGPSKDAVVGPAMPLVERDGRVNYRPMKYEEYREAQLTTSRVDGKSLLEQMMIEEH